MTQHQLREREDEPSDSFISFSNGFKKRKKTILPLIISSGVCVYYTPRRNNKRLKITVVNINIQMRKKKFQARARSQSINSFFFNSSILSDTYRSVIFSLLFTENVMVCFLFFIGHLNIYRWHIQKKKKSDSEESAAPPRWLSPIGSWTG